MRKRIRIIYPRREPTFSEQLEERARSIVENADTRDPLAAGVVDEIRLTLDHLAGTRALHQDLRRQLLRLECYIDTEIMQREPRPPVYEDKRIAERDMLRGRLLRIEHERRRSAKEEFTAICILVHRLHDSILQQQINQT